MPLLSLFEYVVRRVARVEVIRGENQVIPRQPQPPWIAMILTMIRAKRYDTALVNWNTSFVEQVTILENRHKPLFLLGPIRNHRSTRIKCGFSVTSPYIRGIVAIHISTQPRAMVLMLVASLYLRTMSLLDLRR